MHISRAYSQSLVQNTGSGLHTYWSMYVVTGTTVTNQITAFDLFELLMHDVIAT